MATELSHNLLRKIINSEPVFDDMWNTVEDSPYHREQNVLVHTQMVISWYTENVSPKEDWGYLGLFACLMHDIAKPCCRTRKENKERGVYYGYDKHDIVGAKMAEEILVKYDVHPFDIYRICWMVEHHQIFWGTKKKDQRLQMYKTLLQRDFLQPFKYFMLADTYGRITDDEKPNGEKFFEDFQAECLPILGRLGNYENNIEV